MLIPRQTSARRTRLCLLVGALIIGGVVFHQLRYLFDFIFAGKLSDSIEVLDSCSRQSPGLKPSNDPPSHQHATVPGIPNKVHQIWKTSNISTYAAGASCDSWKNVYEPLNYTVKLWPEAEIVELIASKYSWLLPTYLSYPYNIQRADIARLVVVHSEGGMYMDLDVRPRSVENTQCLQNRGLDGVFASTGGTRGLSNHFLMAEQGSAFLEFVLREAVRRAPASRLILLPYIQVFWSTGPMMLTSTFLHYAKTNPAAASRVAVLTETYGKTIMGHMPGRSWHSWDGQLLNMIGDVFSPHNKKLWMPLVMPVLSISIAASVIVGVLVYLRRRCVYEAVKLH
ncbi:hypothetical protein TWF694_011251 [Orbilia ellipsospora]|uniref:Uncharacterized protein n=1 Tax=Orbilia ellipsospora TaxID=2528407 RepID=A0AAV9X9V0_9PEZI